MQNAFDDTNPITDSFNLEQYLDFLGVDFMDDIAIHAQDSTCMCTAPASQGLAFLPPAGSPASMISLVGSGQQKSDPSTSPSAVTMPQFVGDFGAIGLHHSLPMVQDGSTNPPNFVRSPQPQDFAQPQPNLAQSMPQSSISPISTATSAPPLGRLRSPNIWHETIQAPPVFPEDLDALWLPKLPPKATKKQRAERKREQNKLAARRVRLRRLAEFSRLEDDIVRLRREAVIWRERARMLEGLLHNMGVITNATNLD